VHPTRAEAGVTLAATSTELDSITPLVPAPAPAAAEPPLSSAAGIGVIVLLGAALLVLGFATIPSRTLDELSGQLAERREDIGLAIALTIALTAAVFLLFVAA
jgi:hypothetical protein